MAAVESSSERITADVTVAPVCEVQVQRPIKVVVTYDDAHTADSGLTRSYQSARDANLGAITTPTLPARDIDGTTNGEGCMIGLLFVAASTLAATNALATVSYTNSAGVAGRTATLTAIAGSQAPQTPVIGTLIWFSLAAGDTGVRSIQSFTIGATSWLTGTISLFISRDIMTVGTTIPNVSVVKSVQAPGVKLYNGTCLLHCQLTSATTATFLSGSLSVMER